MRIAGFHALGLLFDRERYEAGHSDFLKLLHSAADEEKQTDEEDALDQENLEAASVDEESSTSTSITQSGSDPTFIEQCKVQVVITVLPSTGRPKN